MTVTDYYFECIQDTFESLWCWQNVDPEMEQALLELATDWTTSSPLLPGGFFMEEELDEFDDELWDQVGKDLEEARLNIGMAFPKLERVI